MRTRSNALGPQEGNFVLCLTVAALGAILLISPNVRADVISFEDNWGEAGFNLIQQSPTEVEVVFSVPYMNVEDIEIDGERMQNVHIPGVILPNNAGAPNLSGTGRFIALPQGARAELEVVDYRTEVFPNMNIAPAFEIPFENDDSPLKYEKDRNIYDLDAYYPAEPVMISQPAGMRGVDAVVVGITPFQYNPVTWELIVYKDLRIRVHFIGGNGHFGEDRLRSRWWEPVLQQNLLNYASLPQVDFNRVSLTEEDNVEYLIIVPNDANFIQWADSLKRWRNEQGIITGVTTLSEIGGNNYTLIENYIDNAYWNWSIPPVAVLLLSDYQSSGDLYGITAPTYYYGSYSCVSDNFYADRQYNDNLPDLHVARITAQNYNHLQTMITKMLSYERFPYTNPNFYHQPLIAGGWQWDRWFILCCEVIWGYMHNELGKNPVRQYAGTSGAPSYWSTNSNTYMVVNYFGPSGLGYIPSTPSYLTNWSGNASGINAAINSGAFFVLHRDHGIENGWGTPSYNNSNLSGLYNTMYPYVFSVNCLTGKYNWGSECFTEAFHRYNYRALGVLAASETSYSFVNDVYIWGVFDSMWPDFDPYYGADPIGEDNLRPAIGNSSGKYYLAASSWPYNPGNKDETYYLFHHHGDAFMTLYSEVPQPLTVSHASTVSSTAGSFTVTANDGSLIGLSQSGSVVGSAEGTGSPLSIPISTLAPGIPMRVTVTKANYYRYISDVTVEGGLPDLDIELGYISGSPVAPSGGYLNFSILIENNDSVPLTFDAWIEIAYEGGAPSTVAQRYLTLQPGWAINRPSMLWWIPNSYLAGNYTFTGKVGVHPDVVWDESGFPFTKSGIYAGGDFTPFVPEGGFPDPFGEITKLEANQPIEFAVLSNYPNPFNPLTTISFSLPEAARVKLAVYNLQGMMVAQLVDGYRSAGVHEVTFDASDLASGLYVYRIEAGGVTSTEKMILMK